jgi:tetratricopeptide (TPR) repeat protein
MMFDLMPEEKKEQFSRAMDNDRQSYQNTLDEVLFNMYKKDFEKALNIIEPLVAKIESVKAFTNDEVSEYFTFDEYFEEVLYRIRSKTKKTIRLAPIPYSRIYHVYGCLLVELGRISEAEKVLEKGLRWNPYDALILSEYAETFKMRKMLDRFLEQTVDSFQYLFKPEGLARAYRDLGYYFTENEMYAEAKSMYLLSLRFDKENKNAMSELYYIDQKTDGKVTELPLSQLKPAADTYGFPIGADRTVLSAAYSIGKDLYDKNDRNAVYFLSILYALTEDDEIKGMIDRIGRPA